MYMGGVLPGDDRGASLAALMESPMQNINVNRYNPPAGGYLGSIMPEDGNWILFIHQDGGVPDLFTREALVPGETQTGHGYANVVHLAVEAALRAEEAKRAAAVPVANVGPAE